MYSDKSGLACCLYIALIVVGGILVVFLRLHKPPANGKQGQIPKEMSQILLTNKKQGNLDFKYTPLTLLSQHKLSLTARNILLRYKIVRARKKLNKWLCPLFRPRTIHWRRKNYLEQFLVDFACQWQWQKLLAGKWQTCGLDEDTYYCTVYVRVMSLN